MIMKHQGWFWSCLLTVVGGVCLLAAWGPDRGEEPVPVADVDAGVEPAVMTTTMTAPRSEPEVPTNAPRFPPEYFRKYPPSSRIPMDVPYVDAGIEVGPGQFVPPLNGVKVEDGIPAIGRNPRLPPPGPVVAKVVAPDGQEYWEHQDGSYTSCTYSKIRTAEGQSKEIVATQHGAIAGTRRRAAR